MKCVAGCVNCSIRFMKWLLSLVGLPLSEPVHKIKRCGKWLHIILHSGSRMPMECIIAITTHTLLDIVIPVGIAYLTKWGVIAIAFIPWQICEIWMQKKYNNNTFRFIKMALPFSCRYKTLMGEPCRKDSFSLAYGQNIGLENLNTTSWSKGNSHITAKKH